MLARLETQRKSPHSFEDFVPISDKRLNDCAKCQWCRFTKDPKTEIISNATHECKICNGVMFCGIECLNNFHKH